MKKQESTHSNAELAIKANKAAVAKNECGLEKFLLCSRTTQGGLASIQSVCANGKMDVKNGFSHTKSQERENAICVGSELASRMFKSSRFSCPRAVSFPTVPS